MRKCQQVHMVTQAFLVDTLIFPNDCSTKLTKTLHIMNNCMQCNARAKLHSPHEIISMMGKTGQDA